MAISYRGGVTSPIMLGNDATTQTLFSIENGIASRVNILIRALDVDLDNIAALTAVMPLLKTSRGVSISGGVTAGGRRCSGCAHGSFNCYPLRKA